MIPIRSSTIFRPILTTVIAAAGLLSSCSLRINEPLEPQETFQVNVAVSCLTDSGGSLDRFFSGVATPQEIDQFWGCLNSSITTFLNNTLGKDPNAYAPRELANFIGRFFLKDASIQPELLRELMLVKVALFGGNADRLSRTEILQIQNLLTHFAQASKKISPYMPLTPAKILARANSAKEIDEVMAEVEETGKILTFALENGLGDYSFARFENLLLQLEIYGRQNGVTAEWAKDLRLQIPLMKKIKSFTVSPYVEGVKKDEWKQLAEIGPKVYSLYLRFQLFFPKAMPELKGENLYRFVLLMDEAIPILENALKKRTEAKITAAEVTDIIQELHKRKIVGQKPEEIEQVLAIVLKRFLPDPQAKNPLDISLRNIAEFRTFYTYCIEGLRTISAIFGHDPANENLSKKILTRKQALARLESQGDKLALFSTEVRAVLYADLKFILKNVSTVHPSGEKIVVIKGPGDIPQSQSHLLKLFTYNTANKLAIRAYGNSKKNSISEKQIRSMLSELAPIFQLLNINSKSFATGLSSRLFEASLFLPSSDRYQNLNQLEALELESLLFSVVTEAPTLHDAIQKYCRTRLEKIQAPCYREEMAERISRSLRGTPLMGAALAQLPIPDRVEVIANLDQFLRKNKIDAAYTEDDTRSILLTMYYIELLFYRFDKNENGVFDNAEAQLAYPFFQTFIADKAAALGRKDPEEHYKIYTYILAKQKVPSTFFEKLDYLNWQPTKPFQIDRQGILWLFSTLISF